MTSRFITVLIAAATGALSASAADVPYGADGLPYLVRKSSLAVEVGSARALESAPSFVVYEINARRVLKGSLDTTGPIVALAPRVAEAPDPKALTGGVVFLEGPLDEPARRQRGIKSDRPVYDLVAGRAGAIPGSDERALATAREYLSLSGSDARLAWAVERVTNPDPFVQRSALLELAEPSRKLADDAVVGRLLESLRSDKVRADNKGVAVQLLEQTRSPRASAALAELARTTGAPPVLRQEAVRALGSVPGGEAVLRELREAKDPMVAPAAQRALELIRPEGQARVRPEDVRKYQTQLVSPDPRVRREGASALGKLQYSEEVVRDLRQAALDPKEANPSVRLAAIESLSRFSKADSAEALKAVASDGSLPSSLRAAAVMGIAKLETGVGLAALKSLAESVRDPEIKKLASGLADQQ